MPDKNELLRIESLRNPATRTVAFEQLVKDFSPQLYMQIRRIVQFHDDADDVLQNTFIKAWQGIESFRGDAQLSTWLYKIALNESLAFLSRCKNVQSLDNVDSDAIRTLESDV